MKSLLIKLIRLYQKYISANRPPSCKYYPTCSAYAIESLQEHNIFKAVLKSTWRILRCNPFSKGGYDPVIPSKNSDKNSSTNVDGDGSELNYKKVKNGK